MEAMRNGTFLVQTGSLALEKMDIAGDNVMEITIKM